MADLQIVISAKDQSAAALKSAEQNVQGLGKQLSDIGKIASGIMASNAIENFGRKFADSITGSIKAASDLNESITKSQVVFGASATEISAWAATASKSLGQSNQQALEAAATFGNLFKSLGLGQTDITSMSKSVVGLATDLASFNNASPEETLMALRSGLVGEIEPLRKYGIAINEATVQQKAIDLGLAANKESLTEAAKVQARYALILEQSKTAQGDFARTSEGAANQARILAAVQADLAAKEGAVLLPIQIALNKAILAMPEGLQAAVFITEKFGSALLPLVAVLGQAALAAKAYSSSQAAVAVATEANVAATATSATATGGLAASLGGLATVLGPIALSFVAAYGAQQVYNRVVGDNAFTVKSLEEAEARLATTHGLERIALEGVIAKARELPPAFSEAQAAVNSLSIGSDALTQHLAGVGAALTANGIKWSQDVQAEVASMQATENHKAVVDAALESLRNSNDATDQAIVKARDDAEAKRLQSERLAAFSQTLGGHVQQLYESANATQLDAEAKQIWADATGQQLDREGNLIPTVEELTARILDSEDAERRNVDAIRAAYTARGIETDENGRAIRTFEDLVQGQIKSINNSKEMSKATDEAHRRLGDLVTTAGSATKAVSSYSAAVNDASLANAKFGNSTVTGAGRSLSGGGASSGGSAARGGGANAGGGGGGAVGFYTMTPGPYTIGGSGSNTLGVASNTPRLPAGMSTLGYTTPEGNARYTSAGIYRGWPGNSPEAALAATGGGATGPLVIGADGKVYRSYASGTSFVPGNGLAYLHRGEAVIPAGQNSGPVNIHLSIPGMSDFVIRTTRDAILRGGFTGVLSPT